jgi:hypothetical protein
MLPFHFNKKSKQFLLVTNTILFKSNNKLIHVITRKYNFVCRLNQTNAVKKYQELKDK